MTPDTLHKYRLRVSLAGGVTCVMLGLFASGWAAIDAMLTQYPLARAISARRLK